MASSECLKTPYGLNQPRFLIVLICFASLFTGCIQYPSVVEIGEVAIVAGTDSSVVISAVAQIDNPNRFSIQLTKMEFAMEVFDAVLGKGSETVSLNLPAQKIVAQEMQVEVDLAALEKILPDLLAESSTIVGIDGIYGFELLGREWTLQAQNEVEIQTEELMEEMMAEVLGNGNLQIQNMNQVGLGLTQTRFDFDLLMTNELPLDFEVKAADYALYKSRKKGDLLGKSRLQDPVFVPQGETITIPVSLPIDNLALLGNLPGLFQNGNPTENWILKGEAVIGIGEHEFSVPFEQAVGEVMEESPIKLPQFPFFR